MDETTQLLTLWLKDMPGNKLDEGMLKNALKNKAGEVSISKNEVIDFMKKFY